MAGWKPSPGLTEEEVREILAGTEILAIMFTATDAVDLRRRLVQFWSDERVRVIAETLTAPSEKANSHQTER